MEVWLLYQVVGVDIAIILYAKNLISDRQDSLISKVLGDGARLVFTFRLSFFGSRQPPMIIARTKHPCSGGHSDLHADLMSDV
jgi:hypothetical protein